MIEDYLKEFGQIIGIPDLQLGQKSCLSLTIESAGTLYIEKRDTKIFFYILKQFNESELSSQFYKKAFAMVFNQETYPFTIQAVSKSNDDIGFLIEINDNECNLQTINKIFKFLVQLIGKL